MASKFALGQDQIWYAFVHGLHILLLIRMPFTFTHIHIIYTNMIQILNHSPTKLGEVQQTFLALLQYCRHYVNFKVFHLLML